MTVDDEVLKRADALMQDAPGAVSVRRITHIDEVRVLRAARDELTALEQKRLRSLRLELMERLDGIAAPPAQPEPAGKKGLLGRFLAPLLAAAQGFSSEVRNQGEIAHMQGNAGEPVRLPAPGPLLDAAEAWVIAGWVEDRIDADVECLRRPWQEAAVEPAN